MHLALYRAPLCSILSLHITDIMDDGMMLPKWAAV